jgi:hypothetical protein
MGGQCCLRKTYSLNERQKPGELKEAAYHAPSTQATAF